MAHGQFTPSGRRTLVMLFFVIPRACSFWRSAFPSRDCRHCGVIKDGANGRHRVAANETETMNGNQPGHEDGALCALLKEWKATPDLPAGFQNQVWRRIERAESQATVSIPLRIVWTNWIATLLPRPVLATAYLALFLALGATFGWAQARHETERVSGDLSARYVRLVDPYQAPR